MLPHDRATPALEIQVEEGIDPRSVELFSALRPILVGVPLEVTIEAVQHLLAYEMLKRSHDVDQALLVADSIRNGIVFCYESNLQNVSVGEGWT